MATMSVAQSEVKPSTWHILTGVEAGEIEYKASYPEGLGTFDNNDPYFFSLPSGDFMGDGIVDGDFLWAYDPTGPFRSYRIKAVNSGMSLELYDEPGGFGAAATKGAWISSIDSYVASAVRATMLAGSNYLVPPPNATKCCMTVTNSAGAGKSIKVEAYGYPKLAGDGTLLKTKTFTSLAAQDSDGNYLSAAESFNLRGCHYIDFAITSITAGTNIVKVMFY